MFATGLVLGVLAGGAPLAHFERTMGMALIAGYGPEHYEPPKVEQVPTPDIPPAASQMPAPAPQITVSDMAVPKQADTGRPVQGSLPAPIAASEGPPRFDQLAQASPSNEEILRRLERLEQENQRLKQELDTARSASPLPAAPPSPGSLQPRQAPAQMIGGWRVSLYPWNRESSTTGGATSVFNMPNQRFNATLGQAPPNPNNWNRVHRPSTEMFVYKFEGWLHVTKPGRHEVGFEMNCGFNHPCNLVVDLGGVQLINKRAVNFTNTILQAGLDLERGDYPIEVVFGISQNRFINFQPAGVSIYPLYRPPGEYNFRTFGPSELLTEASPSIPNGMPRR